MNWYLAKVVYQINCGNGNHHPQFDEQLRLIAGANQQHAIMKAEQTGRHEEHSFFNEKKQLVRWKFIGVTELHQLIKQSDGAEVFSKIQEPEDELSYLKAIQEQSVTLQSGKAPDDTFTTLRSFSKK